MRPNLFATKACLPKPLKAIVKKLVVRSGLSTWLGLESPYEVPVTAAIKRLVKPGWVCADIGANVGSITKTLAKHVGPSGKVYAFEAHPVNVGTLLQNIQTHGYEDRVHVEHVACSDGGSKFLKLYAGRGCSSEEWNIVGHDVDGHTTAAEMEVRATSLDDYFAVGVSLQFVKIDVEGAGALVLTGMRRILREDRPIVIMEFHDEVEWSGRRELMEAGYVLSQMDGTCVTDLLNAERMYHCLAFPAETLGQESYIKQGREA